MKHSHTKLENRALSHLDADGVFYIRGVRYAMVSKDEGGYIGVVYGKVWLAKRDADAPMHDLRFHERDLVSELLNRPEICVKVFRVEKVKVPEVLQALGTQEEKCNCTRGPVITSMV